MGALPLPPKKTVAEHIHTQAEFLTNQLEPALAEARAGTRQLFFVDAAHFVMGSFLCCVWSVMRLMIRAASGRQRYSVLGALNAVTRELVRVTTDGVVSSDTMCELLQRIATLGLSVPITLVLDNARYQHCAKVMAEATRLKIELMFLPSYSPNLNLIERLWKFVKKKSLYGRSYQTYQEFRAAIDDCLAKTAGEYQPELATLITHRFQTFDEASFLAV